ncbi:hypothetical protein D3C86_2073880 [compost metagenome]
MDEAENWIEQRLAAALNAATTDAHAFPEAVAAELRSLLNGSFQEPRRTAELDVAAKALVLVNKEPKK